jgi:hypothetical protein
MLTISETLATEDFGRPVRREDNWTLPGARALPPAQATISSHFRIETPSTGRRGAEEKNRKKRPSDILGLDIARPESILDA